MVRMYESEANVLKSRKKNAFRTLRKLRISMVAISALGFVNGASAQDRIKVGETIPLTIDTTALPEKVDLSGLPRLRFLTTLDYPPFNFADEYRKPTGFNVDLARAICTVLEIENKCEIQALPWEDLQSALDSRRGEAIIAGHALSAETRETLALSLPYFRYPARFIARSETASDTREPFGELIAGAIVAVERGSPHQAMLKTHFPQASPLVVSGRQEAYSALRDGKAKFLFADGVSLAFFLVSKAADDCCRFVSGPYRDARFTGLGMAIATRPSDVQLLQAINYALGIIQRDGLYADIHARYFPISPYQVTIEE